MSSNLDLGPFAGGNIAIVQDQRSSGVAGDALTGTVADQTINTIVRNKSWLISVSANLITLAPGDYNVYVYDRWSLPSSPVGVSVTCLVTDSSNAILGVGQSNHRVASALDNLSFVANFTLATQTGIKYRALIEFATASRFAISEGTELYQKLIIEKVG